MDVKKDEMTEIIANEISTVTGSAVTDSTVTDPVAAANIPAETNLTIADPAAAGSAENGSTITGQTIAAPAKTDLIVTDTAAVDPAGTDSTEEEPAAPKNEGKKRILWGILELTAAALIFIISFYLFLNTRGTKLLFVSVTFGRICRYYWIGLLAAIILGLVGWITIRRYSHAIRNRE